ncbi:Leucine-rich repeat-containing protein 9 [Entophlyctis luteolus]|nr:Leucine-rich repeat-containing protein 9 [Entophlyctis luteolus]
MDEKKIEEALRALMKAKKTTERRIDDLNLTDPASQERGNVRFEDYEANDSWFEICESLVKSMILRSNYAQGQKRVQIHRISKVHNRHLKNAFEAKVKSMTESLHTLEYLCFQDSEAFCDDIFQTIEHGFAESSSNMQEQSQLSSIMVPVFTNYLDFVEPESKADRKKLRQAIILRAVSNRSSQVNEDAVKFGINHADSLGIDLYYHDLGQKSSQGDVPCRKYFVVNKELITPEFFVEFSLECDLDRFTTKTEKLMLDIAYSNKLSQPDMPEIVMDIIKTVVDTEEGASLFDAFTMPIIEVQFPEIKRIGAYGVPPPVEMALEILGKKAPANIKNLNLSFYSKLPSLATFRIFSALKSLTLSNCNLVEIPANLKYFPNLEKLDISFNEIQLLNSGLQELSHHLKILDLAGNRLSQSKDLTQIQMSLTEISEIDLRLNPVSKLKGYPHLLLGNGGCSKLERLDGCLVDPSAKHADTLSMILQKKSIVCQDSNFPAPMSWNDVFYEHSSTQQHLFRPLSVRTQSGYGSSAALNEYWRVTSGSYEGHNFIVENMTTLELDNCNLYNLDMLPLGLIHLRWASFRNNNISDVSKLCLCPRLEELSLENNEIEAIDCLASLVGLTKLDVSKNKISAVEKAANFTSLMLLSLENNLIKSIKSFSKMSSLMEFYIGNNCIADLYNIFPLKELPRLIILDVTGNSVCQQAHYRMFTIFHLSRLKILDGTGITPKEQSASKELYLGKLTIELLGAKIGHFSFRNISELDLRNCKIKEADCFVGSHAADFRNIRRLQFDANQLSSLDAFACLQGLRCLCLNNNRVDKILNADLPAVVGLNGWRVDNAEFHRRAIFPNLEELHLGNNNISRIADMGFYRFGQLKRLYLQGNKITRIDGLEHMTTLVELVLDRNQIKTADPSSFLSLINLKELHIKENRLRSLSHFDCLPNLQYLFLNGNRISEVIEIEKMKLPSLLELSLLSNTVSRKVLYRVVVVLRLPQVVVIDGREVTEDDRKRAEAYSMDQCMVQNEVQSVSKQPLAMGSSQGINGSNTTLSKLPIRITSVVLDGLEMKLSASSSGFGSNHRFHQ